MRKIASSADLKNVIQELEFRQAEEYILLKEQLHYTYERLQPINIIKNTFKEMYTAPRLKTNIITSVIGMASGFVAKKVFLGKTHNPFTRLLGSIVEMVVASKVTKNGDKIKSIGGIIMKRFVNNSNETDTV